MKLIKFGTVQFYSPNTRDCDFNLRDYSSAELAALKAQLHSACWHWQRCFPRHAGDSPAHPDELGSELEHLQAAQGPAGAWGTLRHSRCTMEPCACSIETWHHGIQGKAIQPGGRHHWGVVLALSTDAQAQRFEAPGEHLFPPKGLVHNFKGSLDAETSIGHL